MNSHSPHFEPIANPYIVGNPIKDRAMFFGREDDFAYVEKKFSGGKEGGLVVLCGARRSGKTSILFQIQAGRLGPTFLPVLIDMQSMAIRSDKDFLGKLNGAIVAAGFHPEIAKIHDAIASQNENPFTVSEQLVVRLADQCAGQSLILMFDEYELIETHIDSGVITTQILHLLANLIEHRNVFVVFTGSDNLDDRNKRYWDLFLSKALHRRISFLSRRDTLRLISEPVAGRVRYAEGIPERIAALTAGQPFYTQVVCQTVVDRLNEEKKSDVGEADLQKVIDEVIENPLPQMIFNWNALSALERLSLAIIAELSKERVQPVAAESILSFAGREDLGYAIDAGALNKTLEGLFHADLLEKSSEKSAFTFRMDLWRLWVTRMHSVWQVIDEIEKAGGSAPGEGLERRRAKPKRSRVSALQWALMMVGGSLVVALTRGVFSYMEDRADAFRPGSKSAESASGAPIDSAKLAVQSTPAGADVYLEGVLLGKTPLARRVPARRGAMTIVHPGYKDRVEAIDLTDADSAGFAFPLVERSGALRVSSTPPGAEILLDGERSGKTTPDSLAALSANRLHDVTLRLAGFAPRTFSGVRVAEDSTVQLTHAFSRETFPLTINSEPPGAVVTLDGQRIGVTPQLVNQVASGSHVLRLVRDGFAEWEQTIETPCPDVSVMLAPLPPGVIVFSVQPYAEVILDGRPAEDHTITFLSLTRPPGEYSVELRHPEYPPESRTVRVTPGDTVRVSHSFLSPGSGR